MDDAENARIYLRDALEAARVALSHASLAIGHNHAYLQQYVKDGKPLYLKEHDRVRLVRLYNLDEDRLRPPALRFQLQPGEQQAPTVEPGIAVRKGPPKRGEPLDDPDELALIAMFRELNDLKKASLFDHLGANTMPSMRRAS